MTLETPYKFSLLQAVVPGKLICINEVLIKDSSKLVTHTDSEGHIAIILPSKGQYETVTTSLLSEEDYQSKL